MQTISLEQIAADFSALQGIFVTAMPDCLLFDSYTRASHTWESDEIAAYFGDLMRANTRALKSLQNWSSDVQVTVETAESLIILREMQSGFVVSFVFDLGTPIGMVRIHVKRMLVSIQRVLASYEPEEIPRVVRIIEYLQRYAPDPHTSMMRVSLIAGLPMDALQNPQLLTPEQTSQVELAVKNILGIQDLRI